MTNWNQDSIDAAREANRKACPEALKLTPSVLRVLGEGVARCHDGDGDDNAHADLVIEMMDVLGFTYRNRRFGPSEKART